MPKRPPKSWFNKMKRKTKRQYPTYGEKRVNKIVAGIWYGYKPSTRKRILGGKTHMGKSRKKTYRKKSSAKKAKRKGESVYKVKGGWRISRK